MARAGSPLSRYATPRSLKASASFSPLSLPALMREEQPSILCATVAASSPSHHRRPCSVCARAAFTPSAPISRTAKGKNTSTLIESSVPAPPLPAPASGGGKGGGLGERVQIANQAPEALIQHVRV